MSNQTFIWTEVFNCGEIGAVAINSFLTHHPGMIVHIYGTEEDLAFIPDDHAVNKVMLNSGFVAEVYSWLWRNLKIGKPSITEGYLKKGFIRGHLGTARLWSYLISSRPESKFIHFDSDIVFLDNIIKEIEIRLDKFDLIGPVRNYKHNRNKLDHVRHLEDLTQTCCFGFKKNKIKSRKYSELVKMTLGSFNPKGHPVIDFFDPVMFEILGNQGKIFFLNHDEVGGCNLQGSRKNAYEIANDFETPFKIDFGSKLIHFSAVGSGMNVYQNKPLRIPESYRQYALDRYALYAKVFYDRDIGVDLTAYKSLIDYLIRIDTKKWILQDKQTKVN